MQPIINLYLWDEYDMIYYNISKEKLRMRSIKFDSYLKLNFSDKCLHSRAMVQIYESKTTSDTWTVHGYVWNENCSLHNHEL